MSPGVIYGERYQVEDLIGRGGMGQVFQARDLQDGRVVALKVLHREADEEEGREDRFKREIAILSRLRHAAVPAILAWGEREGELYFVSELVDGVALRTETGRRGVWPGREAAALVAGVADALAAAHALGVVHRDVNPNNIMVTRDGSVRLLDFGIARSVGVDITSITTTGTIIGTPGYMAPEQFEARAIDGRTDIYSLGVVLFEMLSGQLPFAGSTPVAVALQHKTEPPPPVRSIRHDVPVWLERVILKCLEKDPVRRFATATALSAELRRARSGSLPRRRRLATGDVAIEDFAEQSEWTLVLASPDRKAEWTPGMALQFDGRFYRLARADTPDAAGREWVYRFTAWPEGDVLRGFVDYEQDCARRAAAARTLSARILRMFGRTP